MWTIICICDHWSKANFVSVVAPDVSIIFREELFSGTQTNQLILDYNPSQSFILTGQYSDAMDYASSAEFDGPDGGVITQGTHHQNGVDVNCNHQGNTTNGSIRFNQTGSYAVIDKVNISGSEYSAKVIVTVEGESLWELCSERREIYEYGSMIMQSATLNLCL